MRGLKLSPVKNTVLRQLLPVILFIFLYQGVNAQFSVDAQLRTRGELRDGFQKIAPGDAVPAILIQQRTRLSFSYETPQMKLKITPQDFRLWGDQPKMSVSGVGHNPSLDLFEAFAAIKAGDMVTISVGRQVLAYDNKRLIGERNWNQGKSYDALVLKLTPGKWNLHAGASWNTLTEASANNHYPSSRIKSLNYLWINRGINERLKLSLMHISSGHTESDTTNPMNFRHTTGFYGNYGGSLIGFWAGAYYQYGKNRSGNRVSASLIESELSLKTGKLSPGIGVSLLSGNSKAPGKGVTDRLFDPLYGNRHGFNGGMDYFTNYPVQTKQGGLADYYIWLSYSFSDKVSVRNTLHHFSLAQSNPMTPKEKQLGFENDLILQYKFSSWGNIETGYAFFLPTGSLKTIQGGDSDNFNQFFYIQLLVSPAIFRQ